MKCVCVYLMLSAHFKTFTDFLVKLFFLVCIVFVYSSCVARSSAQTEVHNVIVHVCEYSKGQTSTSQLSVV